MKYFLKLVLTTIILFSNVTYSWSHVGHQVMSEIAYEQLPTHQKQRLDIILNSFIARLTTENKKTYKMQQQRLSKLAKLSMFPDYWKHKDFVTIADNFQIPYSTIAKNLPLTKTSNWHYQNEILDESSLQTTLEVLIKNTKKTKNPEAKALGIIFIAHLMQDAHQPLHTVSRPIELDSGNSKYKKMDKGGNKFCLQRKQTHQCKYNLHQYWDSAGKLLNKNGSLTILSGEINKHFPKQLFDKRASDLLVSNWIKESRELAPIVYNTQRNTMPSETYKIKCRMISSQQMALSAYRLSELLKIILNT